MLKTKKWGYLTITLLVAGLLFSLIGTAHAAVNISGTDRADLIRTFDVLDKAGNNGNWYRTSTNDSGALAWNEGPVIYSYLRMYEATRDKNYLDRFILHADSILKNRDSERGVSDYRGLSLPAWRAGGKYTLDGKYYIFAAHTGMIASPLADFARIVKEYNLQEYQDKAAVYLQAARDAVAVHDDEWVDEGDQGYYIIRKGAPVWSDGVGIPFNMYLILGEAQISLYQVTGDPIYLERATKMARHFKSHLTVDQATGAYVWNYYWGLAYTGWTAANNPTTNTPEYRGYKNVEDIRHGVLDMRFAEKAYRAGIVFNEQDMIRFGKTVTSNIIKAIDSVAFQVDGRGTDGTNRLTGWTMLYPWAPQILDVDKNAPYIAAGSMAGLSLYIKALSEINGWNETTPPADNGGKGPGDGGITPPSGNEPPEEPVNGGTTPPAEEPPAVPEQVQNGDFSNDRTGWQGKYGEPGVEANGNKYISNGANWGLYQDIALEAGKEYVINADTRKGSAGTAARIVVLGIDAGGRLITTDPVDIRYTHRGAGWESVGATEFTVPPGAVKTRIYLLVESGAGTHDFDNISVKEVQPATPPVTELVQNGNFNSDRTGWDVGKGGVIGVEANGNKYISNGYNWGLAQDLVLEAGKSYLITADTRKGTAGTAARIVIMGVDASGKLITADPVDIKYTHRGAGWESMGATEFTVPPGAVKTRIYLLVNGGTGSHDFDNVSVKAV